MWHFLQLHIKFLQRPPEVLYLHIHSNLSSALKLFKVPAFRIALELHVSYIIIVK